MRHNIRGLLAHSLVAAGAILVSPLTAAAAWPEKPIIIIVAYATGGGNDVTARALAPRLAAQLGADAKVEVVNKPGAGGELGFAAIADAAPDGYTIGMIATPNVVTIPIEHQARYSLDKLDPLLNVVTDPGVWAVRADSPFQNLGDLLKEAGAKPNTVTVGSTGIGSRDHLAILRLHQLTPARFVHVPFPGGSTGDKALAAGKIVVAGSSLGEALRAAEKTQTRVIALATEKRWDMAPEIPTFREQGVDLVASGMRGFAAPKGLPPEIREKLVKGLTSAVADPSFVKESKETFNPLDVKGPEDFAAALAADDAKYKAIWKDAPWTK